MPAELIEQMRKWLWPTGRSDDSDSPQRGAQHAVVSPPHAFVIDDEEGICKLVAASLTTIGLPVRSFHTAQQALAALNRRLPAIIFLDVALEGSDAIDVIRGLSEKSYRGIVQLMSGSDTSLLDDVNRIGLRHDLNMRPPLRKPFRAATIRQVVIDAGLDRKPVPAVGIDEALAKGWLELWYQPKIDLRTKTLSGAEGLIRCHHPEHGTLSPASFLPNASTASHAALTELVVRTALRDWQEVADIGVQLQMAVNTSIGALTKVDLPALVREHRPTHANWPGLILEVTESEVVKDVGLAHEIATQLRIYGITLSIDDFGEGYSSFARLRELPLAELKLDRSFVNDCANDAKNAGICKAIIDLAHNFGAVAVAEGLENASDLQVIHRMGCDIGQGFLLARPMPKSRFLTALRQRALQKVS
jgi:EAL domain-containing protein (putative c-di-GMP-specific phosphodiesterase class I)/CheY-like chemotaxis protein